MCLRRLSVVAAVLSVVLVISGCLRDAPVVTDKHLERWRVMAEEMIPLATQIEVEASVATTMAGNSNSIYFEMTFANFADLKSSNDRVQELEAAITDRMARTSVGTQFVNAGQEALEEEIASHLIDHVPGLERAHATALVNTYLPPESPVLKVHSYLHVEDLEVMDPTWLDKVADHIQKVASDAGGQVYGIAFASAETVKSALGYPIVEDVPISLHDLPTFTELGVDTGCVRTDNWAYDVTNDWVIVHPLGEPEGACV